MQKPIRNASDGDSCAKPVFLAVQRVLKAALVEAALAGRITPEEAFERIQRYGLRNV